MRRAIGNHSLCPALLSMMLNGDDLKWMGAQHGDDVARLRLKYSQDQHLMWLVDQIESRRKGARKVADELALYPGFAFPTVLSAEQCTSDSIARFHASLLEPGSRVLDMTCGLGIDVFHAARRGCMVKTCDINPTMIEALGENARGLGLSDRIEGVYADSIELLKADNLVYDVIFVDPARRGAGGKRLFAMADCSPDIVSNIQLILSRCRRLIFKASPMLDVTAVRQELATASTDIDIITVGTPGECKELMAIMPGTGKLNAVTIDGERVVNEDFVCPDNAEEADEHLLPGKLLYEPYPAVIKAGRYTDLARKYAVTQVSANVHLYISSKAVDNFPGHCYLIENVVPFGKREIKQLLEKYGPVSVTTRNFPLTAAELKKRFKIGESSTRRLWAVTIPRGKTLVVARRP